MKLSKLILLILVTTLAAFLCISQAFAVSVQNGSFEADTSDGVGYLSYSTAITGWVVSPDGCQFGLNNSSQPFADNGTIPDGNEVAFLQKVASLSQTIDGFEAGALYLLTYRENARAETAPATCSVTLGSDTIVAAHSVCATHDQYLYRRAIFQVPSSGSYDLTFHQTTTADSALLLDDVEITEISSNDLSIVNGTVTDGSTSAVIAGAMVVLKNKNTLYDETVKVYTDANGKYSIGSLLPGTYNVMVSKGGYASQKSADIVITTGGTQVINVTLYNSSEIVRNGSFEADAPSPFPGYCTSPDGITEWFADPSSFGFGLNNATIHPFADNGIIPDGNNVAFLQRVSSLSQILDGLEAGVNYLLTFRENARTEVTNPLVDVTIGDDTIIPTYSIAPTRGEYLYKRAVFQVPSNGAYTLTFHQTNTSDATFLFDAVKITTVGATASISGTVTDAATSAVISGASVVLKNKNALYDDTRRLTTDDNGNYSISSLLPGTYVISFGKTGYLNRVSNDIVISGNESEVVNAVLSANMIKNPSFEADTPGAFPGYCSAVDDITDWVATVNDWANGGFGLNNSSGPFADNGIIPDGNNVAFLQRITSLGQAVDGFVAGKYYLLTYRENARAATSAAVVNVTLGSDTIVSSHSVSATGSEYGIKKAVFQVPSDGSYTLTFNQTNGNDSAFLLDDVELAIIANSDLATINGKVTDAATGAAIAGVAVNLTSATANAWVITDDSGMYSAAVLPGTYSLSCESDNYLKQVVNNVSVAQGQTVTKNVAMVPIPETAQEVITDDFERDDSTDLGHTSGSREIYWKTVLDSTPASILGGQLYLDRAQYPDGIFLDDVCAPANFDVTVDVISDFDPSQANPDWIGITYRQDSYKSGFAGGGYYLQLPVWGGTAVLANMGKGVAWGNLSDAYVSTFFDPHTVRIRAIYNHHEVWIDGNKIIDVYDNTKVGGGSVGIVHGSATPVYCDNFSLSTYDLGNFAVDTPTISPKGGRYVVAPNVTLTTSNPDAKIVYTTDGTTPSQTNGTVVVSGTAINAATNMTIKAMAFNDYMESDVVSETYYIGANRPAVIGYSNNINVDGDLSEWSNSDFVKLDQLYDVSDEAGLKADVPEAYYAAKWNESKLYLAVKVRDTDHVFTSTYEDWDARDAVEMYIHTDNGADPSYYSTQNYAQQYTVGIVNGTTDQLWSALAYKLDIPASANFSAAGKVSGDWIYYEVALTPFDYYTIDGSTMTPAVLKAGDVVGLDACVVSRTSAGYMGMFGENTDGNKSVNSASFGIHMLGASSDIAGVKTSADGTVVLCSGIVSAVFDGYFYIESGERTYGIRVENADNGMTVGEAVSVSGVIRTLTSGERYIDAIGVNEDVSASTATSINPLGMTNKALGGGDYGTASDAKQAGVADGQGLNNIGLLIKTTGAVGTVNASEGWFTIDDGSGVDVTVYGSVPSDATYVTVTGISSCVKLNGSIERAILATDVTKI